MWDEKFRKYLLSLSDEAFDNSMKPLVSKWSSPPKALEVLEVLDHCIYGSLCSGFEISLMQMIYDGACKVENTTHEEMEKLATWRDKLR